MIIDADVWDEISVLACFVKDNLVSNDLDNPVGNIVIPAIEKRIKELIKNG